MSQKKNIHVTYSKAAILPCVGVSGRAAIPPVECIQVTHLINVLNNMDIFKGLPELELNFYNVWELGSDLTWASSYRRCVIGRGSRGGLVGATPMGAKEAADRRHPTET